MIRLPKIVSNLCLGGGLLGGSQAQAYAEGLPPLEGHDWDIVVPFSKWHLVGDLIPATRVCANKFLGWRFMSDGVELDVWPGDLQRTLRTALSYKQQTVYLVDLPNRIVYSAHPPALERNLKAVVV